ncbi:MAG: hypothetical protein Q9205_005402 [Flavoplaca limonia]
MSIWFLVLINAKGSHNDSPSEDEPKRPYSRQKASPRLLPGFNLLGQVAVTTGITFGLANLISTTATVGTSYEPTAAKTLGIYAAVLFSHGVINSFGVRTLRYLNNTSIILHSVGISCFCIAVLAKAPTHQSAKFVFSTFNDATGGDGIGWSVRASPAYVASIGVLMSQYTITGFDASAHLSEETLNASWSAPLGVLLLFSIQDFDTTVGSDYEQPVLQILIDIFGEGGAIVLMTLIMVCVYHCGLFSMTSNSRMMFGFSRDGGLPHFFDRVDKRHRAPIRAIWLAATLSFLLAVPSLGSTVAFSAATSIATIVTGPVRQIQAEQLGIDLEDPAAMEKVEMQAKLGGDYTTLSPEVQKHDDQDTRVRN